MRLENIVRVCILSSPLAGVSKQSSFEHVTSGHRLSLVMGTVINEHGGYVLKHVYV